MHREKHLFPHETEFSNLYLAFLGAAQGKRGQSEVQAFEHQLETRLWEIRRTLEAGTYRWGNYRRFLIQDP